MVPAERYSDPTRSRGCRTNLYIYIYIYNNNNLLQHPFNIPTLALIGVPKVLLMSTKGPTNEEQKLSARGCAAGPAIGR